MENAASRATGEKIMNRHTSKTGLFVMALLCCAIAASSLDPDVMANGPNIGSPAEAAKLAAKLANDEFQRKYGYAPFSQDLILPNSLIQDGDGGESIRPELVDAQRR